MDVLCIVSVLFSILSIDLKGDRVTKHDFKTSLNIPLNNLQIFQFGCHAAAAAYLPGVPSKFVACHESYNSCVFHEYNPTRF